MTAPHGMPYAMSIQINAAPPPVGPIPDGTPLPLVLAHLIARADEWYDGDGRGAGPLAAAIVALRLAADTATAYAGLVKLVSEAGIEANHLRQQLADLLQAAYHQRWIPPTGDLRCNCVVPAGVQGHEITCGVFEQQAR